MAKNKGWILGLFCAAVLALSGCGNGAGQTKTADSTEGQRSEDPAGAMGRYMETARQLPDGINRNGGLGQLSDGTLSVISFGNGLYRSSDGGESWQQEETAWFPMIQNVYCLDAVMGPDGTVAATCSGEMSQAVRDAYGQPVAEDWEGNYCVFGMPDGTVKIVDFGFSQEDGSCIRSFCFKEDGRLFAGDMSGKVYEVNIGNASLKELFTADRAVGYMDFSGNLLMAVGYDRLYLYDLAQKVLLAQDTTIDAFIRQKLPDGTVSYTSGGYPLAVTGGEDTDTVYVACKDGLYRHALGGSVMEQVIDGALSTFGDSTSYIYNIKALDNQEFLALFNPSAGLVRYTFDENIPSMPDKEIRIYSLEENASVRQAVTAYKKEHTDMYVRYEVGMEGDGSVTAEDAVKKLNAQVLAGDGPDVLILDGLPLDSYVEKGMLKDLNTLLEGLDGENALFENLTEGFRDEKGAVYAMPLCIRVPLLVGDRTVIEQMDDLKSFADGMEALRRKKPEGGILGIYDAETLLKLFGMVSSPAWVDGNGQMDTEAVGEFLSQMKRIYDAELAGAVPEEVSSLEAEDETLREYGMDVSAVKQEVCQNVLNIPRGYALLACGYVEAIQLCLDKVTSVLRTDGNLACRIFPGQEPDVFLPEAMVGISARTEQPEEAEEFVRKMFTKGTQENLYEGYPVNRAAFETAFDFYESDAENGSMILQMPDGTEQELFLYWPNAEEKNAFTEQVMALSVPARTGEYVCALVYETGVRVLEGSLSVEDGTEEIGKKAALYLAE